MQRPAALAGIILILATLTACDGPTISEPDAAVALDAPVLAEVGRSIMMLDQCDPESFNAAIGAGTCVDRNGGLTFDKFIQQLESHQTVRSWIFTPQVIHVAHEMTLPVVNRGGEVHTFTEVEEFGGGVVPILNLLSGNTTVAPECTSLGFADFIPAGGQTTHHFEPGEAEKYQCCIHPWMRSVSR